MKILQKCECCGQEVDEDLREWDGEMSCDACIKESLDYEEGMLFVRDNFALDG